MAIQLAPCCFKALQWREGQKGLSNYHVLKQLGRGRSRQQPGPAWSGEASWGRCLCRGLPAPVPAPRHRPASGMHATRLQRAHPAVAAAGVAVAPCLPSSSSPPTGQGRAAPLDGSTGICAAKHSLGLRSSSPPQTHMLTGGHEPCCISTHRISSEEEKKPKVCPSFSWKAKQRPAGTLQPLHSRQTGPAKG